MGDTCHKTISQPRYISFNTAETCFYNHNAKPYHLLPSEIIYRSIPPVNTALVTIPQLGPYNPFKWCENQFQRDHFFIKGGRHKYIVGLARYCNIKGVPESETLYGCIGNYISADFDELEISQIIKHIYTTQSDSLTPSPLNPAFI